MTPYPTLKSHSHEVLLHCLNQNTKIIETLQAGKIPSIESLVLARSYLVLFASINAITHLRADGNTHVLE